MRTMRESIEHGMVVRRWGDGPPLVYIHGLGEAGLCFAPLVADSVLARFTHVVPDLPGYGRSAWPARAQGLDELADHLLAWLAAQPGPRPVLVGHSMGGVLALLMAERAPAALAAIVNIDGNISLGDCTFSGKAAALSLPEMLAGGFDRLREAIYADGANAPELRGYYAALRFADPATYHRHACDLVALSTPETLARRLAALTVPATFLAGVPGGICERSRDLLTTAGARWVAVEPAGHWVYADQPARCAEVIAAVAAAAVAAARA
jgi:pimeloyl-ACP methyl ester carboxylesterase